MRRSARSYRLGAVYAVATALLYGTQEPLCYLGAKRLDAEQFILVTQIALLLSIPLLNFSPKSRRDFMAILADPSKYGKLAVIFGLGAAGLLFYKFGLSGAHPVIVAAILNLSPFWAAVAARWISRVPIPVGPGLFFGCLVAAFCGAMAVTWSQLDPKQLASAGNLWTSLLHGTWVFVVPIPIFTALSGTLIGKWFSEYEETAAVGVNFLTPAVVLIPILAFLLARRGGLNFDQWTAIVLMVLGTVLAASVGRVLYQVALTATGGDNGFVSMFFLLVPALTALVSLPLSKWIADLYFRIDVLFFAGLALIAGSLLLFSLRGFRSEQAASAGAREAARAA